MVRLFYVTLLSAPIVIFYLIKSRYVMNHIERFSESYRYGMVRHMIHVMNRNGRIRQEIYGTENLPEEGGYVMYPNHQGKYDALGIITGHERPCTFLIDDVRSRLPFARQVADLLQASRLDKTDFRSQVRTFQDIIRQVSAGKRFIVFPEGGYEGNRNTTRDFLPGAFGCSVKSRTPIIPVALIDTYKVFGINSLRKVRPQIHFLAPLTYEEYRSMNTAEIAALVRRRIDEKIRQVLEEMDITAPTSGSMQTEA